ncbi:hypothetical protein Clacol_000095 [Clathrus columnatus]|uniref:Uncharacterized protein n=1 Tax=Clathrus columnatus TaxID=1419009 RepID=A0AAV4ZZT8_9AGAM|nr:hypothetical protein Clacol_000095 [Clathrus columnatus]
MSDASSLKDVSMSVSNENKTISRTPQQLLRMLNLLNILNKVIKPVNLTEPIDPTELQPELQQVLGQNENEEDIQDLLGLAIEHKADIPLVTPDALPPSAFMKRPIPQGTLPTSPPIIVVDDSKPGSTYSTLNILQPQYNPVAYRAKKETFLSDFDTNELLEYMVL